MGKVKFNIVNFTKARSLYEFGQKICVCSLREKAALVRKLLKDGPVTSLEKD